MGGEGQLTVQLQAEEGGRLLVAERLAAEAELRFDLAAAFLGVQREGGHHALGVARLDLPSLHPAADLIQGRLEPVRALLQGAARREKGHVVCEEGDKRLLVAGPESVVDVVAVDEPEEGGKHAALGQAFLEDPPPGG